MGALRRDHGERKRHRLLDLDRPAGASGMASMAEMQRNPRCACRADRSRPGAAVKRVRWRPWQWESEFVAQISLDPVEGRTQIVEVEEGTWVLNQEEIPAAAFDSKKERSGSNRPSANVKQLVSNGLLLATHGRRLTESD